MTHRFASVSRRAFLHAGAGMIGAGTASVGVAFAEEQNRERPKA